MTIYIRQEAQSYAKILIPIVFITSLAIMMLLMRDQSKQELQQSGLIMMPSSILVSFVLLCSFKKLALIELLFPVMYTPAALVVILAWSADLVGPPTEATRIQALFVMAFIYCLFTLFLGASWFSGFLTRMLLHVPSTLYFMIERQRQEEAGV